MGIVWIVHFQDRDESVCVITIHDTRQGRETGPVFVSIAGKRFLDYIR
jgi:hypothetical protein